MAMKGMLDKYVGCNVNLVLDMGVETKEIKPIKVVGKLVEPRDGEHIDEYSVLINDWEALITFTVSQAMVKLELGDQGVVEEITLTVLPQEEF